MKTAGRKTLETLSQSTRYNNWIFHAIRPHIHGTVLDIGSGLGDIAAHYQQCAVDHVYVSDPDAALRACLKQRFASVSNYSVLDLDILKPGGRVLNPKPAIDTVTCVNVLEHIKDDRLALKNMRDRLKPAGTLILLVPAFPFLFGTLDTLVGHHRRYRKKDMRRTLAAMDLKIQKMFYMNLWGTFSWFWAGRVMKHKAFHAALCKQLDRLVPVLEACERPLKPLIGQSLVIVCRKE